MEGSWAVDPEKAVLVKAPGKIVFRFFARDLHLVLGPGQDGKPVRVVSDRPHVEMPDPTTDAIVRLQRQLEQFEKRLNELEQGETAGDESWSWVI